MLSLFNFVWKEKKQKQRQEPKLKESRRLHDVAQKLFSFFSLSSTHTHLLLAMLQNE